MCKEFNNRIEQYVLDHKAWIKHLWDNSPYYPFIYRETLKNDIYLSTKVRIKRNGRWLAIHHVQSNHLVIGSQLMNVPSTDYDCLCRLIAEVYKSQLYWKENSSMDVVDGLQISEKARMLPIGFSIDGNDNIILIKTNGK